MTPAPKILPDNRVRQLLDDLAAADPDAAQHLRTHIDGIDPSVMVRQLELSVAAVLTALTIENSYGHALADGVGQLLAAGLEVDLEGYLARVAAAARRGPTLAALMARHLAPVMACRDRGLADRFDRATDIMLRKGTYTLKAPLEALSRLIEDHDQDGALAFLDLLDVTYRLETSYNRTVYLTHTLARAVTGFPQRRRLWQIRGLTRIMAFDERLTDDYLQGLATGLNLLSEKALNTYLDQALYSAGQDLGRGARVLSLESREAKERCRDLQVAVPLSAVRSGLERYLNARTGLAVPIRSLSNCPNTPRDRSVPLPLVHCDGCAIYLPDEMDRLTTRRANTEFYKLLVRLEAGTIEFGTCDMDVEKVLNPSDRPADDEYLPARSALAELLAGVDHPEIALDLFTLFEHGRIHRLVRRRYPGLFRRLADWLDAPPPSLAPEHPVGGTLYPLYRHLIMDAPLDGADPGLLAILHTLSEDFHRQCLTGDATVETSAGLALSSYTCLAGLADIRYQPLCLPFGRHFDPARFAPYHTACHHLALAIRSELAKRNLRVYRKDVHALLVQQGGQISIDDLRTMIVGRPASAATDPVDLSWFDLKELLCRHGMDTPTAASDGADAFRYREWDWSMGDYLPDRVRVLARTVEAAGTDFYRRTLEEHGGLVRRVRYAFELLRPEALTILRQWREGDDFDYRALLDYAVDRKAGLMPSDRLFIKRVKRTRDVATLLLVDLSRSTANAVDNGTKRVLDVEKQAIVLLCEALTVVGDRFAIAGFSGTGPLGVDYYRVKDLDSPFDDSVRGRIGALTPQRSTRMGAAIRHATALLKPIQARVRLIMIMGDGFPNDIEYKATYAVEDTRRAVMEARSAAIHIKAITVNVSDNGQLDRLFGRSHHTLISDVRDLPDRIARVYSALTRH